MLEIELTYLAKYLPADLKDCDHKEIIDIYFPKNNVHPITRLRKIGNKFEMTKKEPVNGHDSSQQTEQTIILNKEEFKALGKVDGLKVRKLRYYYAYQGLTAEFDIFQDSLAGLVVVDFEFETNEDKEAFQIPEFCLADVTQEQFIAGGALCGKDYKDIEAELKKFNYQKLFI